MVAEDQAQDLTTVNLEMAKQHAIETEMVKKAQQIDSLQVHFHSN